MTCTECQLQIFDGELDRDAVVRLKACEECRGLDREVRLNGAALAELGKEILPVRPRRSLAPKGFDLRWVAGLAAAVVLGAMVREAMRPAPEPELVSVKQTFRIPDAPKVSAPEPALPVVSVPKRVAVRPRKPEPAMPLPAQQVLIKLVTDDPEVVIYLVPDPIQGEQAL